MILTSLECNADVILINPPDFKFGRLSRIRKASPPLGLLYLASYLKARGYRVAIIDGMVTPERIKYDGLKANPSLVVGITATTTTIDSALRVAIRVKRENPLSTVVLGGPHPSVCHAELVTRPEVDYVVVGEGELALERICKAVVAGKMVATGGGVVSTDNSLHVPKPEYVKDLDQLPFPDRSLIPFDRYELSPINYKRKPSTPVITTRGCPFKCSFCSNPVHGSRVRFHSAEYVIEEIAYLRRRFGVRDIMFWDDTFSLNATRLEKICNALMRFNGQLTWSCATRVDCIDREQLRLMKAAGCWQISFGVESGVDRLRRNVQKGITEEQIVTAFDACRRIGIETRAFFILGLPTERPEESLATIAFAKALKPDFAQFSLATPYPGSAMYDRAIAEGWKPPQWELFQTYPNDMPVYVPEGRSAAEMVRLQSRAMTGFYLRPSYVIDRFRKIGSMEELIKHVTVFFSFFSFLKK